MSVQGEDLALLYKTWICYKVQFLLFQSEEFVERFSCLMYQPVLILYLILKSCRVLRT